jgi:FkbM family methyltransferase
MKAVAVFSELRASARTYVAHRIGMPELSASLRRLSEHGFDPRRIFDVGAYQGDFARACLAIWPETEVTAFEVLEHKVAELRRLAASGLHIDVIATLLGAENCDAVPLHVMETASSVLEEHLQQDAVTRMHPMRTIDSIVHDSGSESPDFLKLDVQGYELEVLKGAERTLADVEVILAELNFLDIHKGVPLVSDVLAWLAKRDFVAYDVCGLTRRPFDSSLWQADFICVRRDSRFRASKRWS